MNRRDFLLLRTDGQHRVVELSCERLYMRYVDAQGSAGRQSGELPVAEEPWMGEPATVIHARSCEELFQDLDRDLRAADVLRVVGVDWLVSEEFRKRFETLLASFRGRGGRVEFARTETSRLPEAPPPAIGDGLLPR